MRVYGIDFTSRPRRGKPITCLECRLEGDELRAGPLSAWCTFDEFEAALREPGPWIAGIDFRRSDGGFGVRCRCWSTSSR